MEPNDYPGLWVCGCTTKLSNIDKVLKTLKILCRECNNHYDPEEMKKGFTLSTRRGICKPCNSVKTILWKERKINEQARASKRVFKKSVE